MIENFKHFGEFSEDQVIVILDSFYMRFEEPSELQFQIYNDGKESFTVDKYYEELSLYFEVVMDRLEGFCCQTKYQNEIAKFIISYENRVSELLNAKFNTRLLNSLNYAQLLFKDYKPVFDEKSKTISYVHFIPEEIDIVVEQIDTAERDVDKLRLIYATGIYQYLWDKLQTPNPTVIARTIIQLGWLNTTDIKDISSRLYKFEKGEIKKESKKSKEILKNLNFKE